MAGRYSTLLTPASVTWAFTAVSVAILPHSTRFSIWLILAFAVMGGWRVLGAFQLVPLPDKKYVSIWLLKQIFALAIFVATYVSFNGQLGRDAGMAMLTALLGLKLLEMRAPRDFYIVMFLAYFLVVTNLFYSQTLLTAAYMGIVVVLVTAGLIHFNGSQGGLNPRDCFKLSAQYCLQAVPIMVIAFILFPRIPGPLWGMPQNTSDGVTGLSDEMTIGNISRLGVSDEIAFRVKFNGHEPSARDLYWRGPVLGDTNGTTWRGHQKTVRQLPPSIDHEGGEIAPEDLYKYQVIVEPHGEKWVFVLDHLRSAKPAISVTRDHQAIAFKPINRRASYALTSARNRHRETITELERNAALSLPPGYHPRTVSLSEQWLSASNSNRQIIDEALTFYRQQNFIYTLTPKKLSSDAIDSFLFETREGFCEYYASSFVVLMRAAGIPARVVTGYQGGEYNAMSDFMIVRQRDAHAWAEVYLDDEGWVRVDPTAAVAPERVSLGLSEIFPNRSPLSVLDADNPVVFTWNRLRDTWDAVNFNWSRWVLGYSPTRQRQLLDEFGLENWNYGTLIIALTIISAITLTIIALLILKSGVRKCDQTMLIYEKFCRKLAKIGFQRAPHEGPLDFAHRVGKRDTKIAADVDRITRQYISLRYTNGETDIGSFANSVRQFSHRK